METHIDQLRIRSRLSLLAYVEGLKENNMVKKINFIYLDNETFNHVIQGLLCNDGVFGIELRDNIIGKSIDGVYCKLIKGMKWDKELLEKTILSNGINPVTKYKDYTRIRTVYKKQEDG